MLPENGTVITETSQLQVDHQKQKRIKTAKILLSSFLAITGLFILISQLAPLGLSYLNGKILESKIKQIKNPTSEKELNPQDSDLPYYDPGMSYFQNLVQHISPESVAGASTDPNQTNSNINIVVDKDYQKEMKLSIPDIGISNITVTPNVDSFDENVYDSALKKGLAHFEGTPLPGDGGNSFIYGHSAVDSFFSNHPNDPETIFSKLDQVEIPDTIEIQKDGETFTYTVIRKKITDPEDFDVVNGITNKETVTLMTCWPKGISSKRLIVIAELTDG